MALVTVSRSPPASGHSTPVGPTVSLAWTYPFAVGFQLGLREYVLPLADASRLGVGGEGPS